MRIRIIFLLLIGIKIAGAIDQKEATFGDLVEITTEHQKRPAIKNDDHMNAQLDQWLLKLDKKHVKSEWTRLAKDADNYIRDHQNGELNEMGILSRELLKSLIFEMAVEARDFLLITELLETSPIGFLRGFHHAEYRLVRSCGAEAFGCFFRAYAASSKPEARHWLVQRIKRSFGKLVDEVWKTEDSEETAIAKIKMWFEHHVKELRCVEVYAPMGSRQLYFEQGIKSGETLVGLFFVREK